MNKLLLSFSLISLLFFSCKNSTNSELLVEESSENLDTLRYEEEIHLRNLQQLTFGGDNAEAYWSFDGKSLVFQRKHEDSGVMCDQIFIGDIPAANEAFSFKLASTGLGRTTCSYFLQGDSTIIYASTHLANDACPAEPDKSLGYVWALYPEFEIFIADRAGNILEQLTDNEFYDAEATTSPQGNKIVYTSTKSGDIELYVLDLDTREEIQITDELGYDGGAFFSPDGSKLVWRSSRPKTDEEVKHYKDLLANNLVEPSDMELYISDADGSNKIKVTSLGGANWAPFFHPSGNKILFSSNHVTGMFPFNLFMVNLDGTGLEQITFDNTFDSFPMFSPDGKYLVFSSNRNNGGTRDTNMFLAEWVD
ncbi:MAG: PD40 domain-containing protein [Chitinophagales bacterium]|nr:PD40 domain-containing protein [Chitinophagales bacterium]